VLGPGLGVVIPYFLGRAIDAVTNGTAITPFAAAILVLALLQAGARSLGSITINGAAREAEHDLRMEAFSHLVALDGGFYRKQKTGDVVSRLTSDLQTLMQMWGTGIFMVFGIVLLLLFSIIAMVTIDPFLTLCALAPIPLIVIASQYLSKLVKRLGMDMSQRRGQLSSTVHEDLAGIAVVKTYGLENQRGQHFTDQSKRLMRASLAVQRASLVYGPLTGAFVTAGTIVVLWLGGHSVIEGKLGLGTLVQFNTYLALLGGRIVGLAAVLPVFQQGDVAWQRISAMLARPAAIVDGPAAPPATFRGDIELRDLAIEVEGRRLIDGVSLTLPAGTLTVVVGRVGGGKSTLVEAIPRLLDAPPERVFIDGSDVRDLPLAAVRGAIAYAPQQAFLFSATIAENIAFGIDGSPPDIAERVRNAAKIAGLEPDLAALPNGLETQVGERGITLSGGQRQRVALARAIASDRRIVLLDDSLSAVDTATERRILDGLAEAFRGRTVVMVSHRVAVTSRADQIAVIDGGKLVEIGKHDELVARGGVYADLYRSQEAAA
jgi:ATP-binding cassette subfamily B protein